jgi:hypothetical protein
LTIFEYDNALRELLKDTTRPAARLLPDDGRRPFDNDTGVQVPSKALVEGLELLARDASARLLADKPRRDSIVGCMPTAPTDRVCFRSFLGRFGPRALRRALGADELTRFEGLITLAGESGDFYTAVETAIQAFLQHGEFIYRVETGAPVAGQTGLFKVRGSEMASRLSFFLTGSPPDDPLLAMGIADKLNTGDAVRAAAATLLKDPRAREILARLHALWLGYETLPFAAALGSALQAETTALVDRVILRDRLPWQTLFRLDETFIPESLATHYGLPWPGGTAARWVKDPTGRRKGLLAQGSFLSNGAKNNDTSPTMRGIAVRERLLCQDVPSPPPGLNTADPPPASPDAPCKEDRYRVHAAPGCASCHKLIDPIGFGLENYDSQGRFRSNEVKTPACVIKGQGEVESMGKFSGPAELGALLSATPQLSHCAVTQVVRYALGHGTLTPTDTRLVDGMQARVSPKGEDFLFDDLILDLVSSEAFRHRREEILP